MAQENGKTRLKKMIAPALTCVWVLGTIGCPASLFFVGNYVFGVVALGMAGLAFPTILREWKNNWQH